jgi:hypothetical protein
MASQHNCITLTLFLSRSSDCNNDHSHQFSKVILQVQKQKKEEIMNPRQLQTANL